MPARRLPGRLRGRGHSPSCSFQKGTGKVITTKTYRASRFGLGCSAVALALGMAVTPAFAQATSAAAGEDEVIIVTGSRIARPDLAATAPLQLVGAPEIQASGAGNLQDVLADLPAVGQNISRTSSNFSTTGNGIATVNLRNLGSDRTLVLVNGRRFVAGQPGTSRVDLNTIPTDLIKRVDIVTGGASAVYGSEAIAGVVNFIMDDKFEGLRGKLQNNISDEGDAERYYGSLTAGTSFAGGAGHIVVYGQFDLDKGLRSRNRGFSATDIPNRSSFAAQGLFSPNDSFAPGANTFTFDSGNTLKQYQSANIDGYNRNNDRYLSVPVDRYMGAALGSYEFSDSITGYAEFYFTKTKSASSLEPQAVANTDINNPDGSVYAGIPITNPFIPTAIRNAMIAAGVTDLPFRRRSNDIFDRSNRNDRETWRAVLGFKGDIGEKWTWDISYVHGQTKDYTRSETILGPNYRNALNAVAGPGGTPVCSINVDADPTNNDPSCSPINIFGFDTVSAAAANYVTANGLLSTYNAKTTQDVVAGSIQGELFDLPGGGLSIAVGGEYRREKSVEDFDEATNLGLTLGNFLSDTRGKYNVKEAFIEVNAPILKEVPFAYALSVGAAARYADYSTVGGVWSWKVDGEYAPIRDIRFVATYAEATRAPNISELFSAQSETFPAVIDPCDQAEGNGDGAPITVPRASLPAGCLAVPGIAAASQTPGGFTYSTAQIQNINGFLGGNPNLTEETAKTLTLGVVLQPSFARGFSLRVDYYRIKVQDAIGIIGQQTSLDECLTGGGQDIFCNNIIRDVTGRVTTVNALNLNTGSFEVEGIDTEARFARKWGDTSLDLTVRWNHKLKQNQTSFPGGPTQKEVGQLDCYSCGRLGTGFKDRVVTNAIIAYKNVSLSWKADYMSAVVDDLTKAPAAQISTGAYWYHDAQLRFNLDDDKYTFFVGMNNVFDKKPPVFGDTNLVTFPGAQTSANTYDLYGRMIYAGVTFNF